MQSTVPAAKAALKALLEARTWDAATPKIRWGGPTETEDFPKGGEVIYFGDTEIQDNNQTLGATRYDETYNLRLVIDVKAYGDDEQRTEQRGWDLYGEVIELLDANRELGGVLSRMTDRTVRQTNVPLPSEWLARIVVDQGCVGLVFNP